MEYSLSAEKRNYNQKSNSTEIIFTKLMLNNEFPFADIDVCGDPPDGSQEV